MENNKKPGVSKRIISLILLALIIFIVSRCYMGSKTALVGRWITAKDYINHTSWDSIVLNQDGTGVIDNFGITWTAGSGRITVKFDIGFATVCEYEISSGRNFNGHTLKLTDDEGYSNYYDKK